MKYLCYIRTNNQISKYQAIHRIIKTTHKNNKRKNMKKNPRNNAARKSSHPKK